MQKCTSNYVIIFTDESFINVNYGYKNSYLPNDKNKDAKNNKKNMKGTQLLNLNFIGKPGPLVEYYPVKDFPEY